MSPQVEINAAAQFHLALNRLKRKLQDSMLPLYLSHWFFLCYFWCIDEGVLDFFSAYKVLTRPGLIDEPDKIGRLVTTAWLWSMDDSSYSRLT